MKRHLVLLCLSACACTGQMVSPGADVGPRADSGVVGDAQGNDSSAPPARVDSGMGVIGAPILSNFRVEPGEANRVRFDSSEAIIGSSTDGFTISGKGISGVTINDANTTGHYFTVSSPFTFWDNNTIRYEGGGDFADADSNALHDFTLQYIDNEIGEPVSTAFRFTSVTGEGTHDGTSEANAWTLSEAASGATAGMTVWLKAGNYGAQQLRVAGKATSESSPLKFVGYRNTPGDITSMYYTYARPVGGAVGVHNLDASEMPLLSDYGRSVSGALVRVTNDFVIIRNLQAEGGAFNYEENGGRDGIIFDNTISLEARSIKSGYQTQYASSRIRVINSVSINNEMSNIFLGGSDGLIENTENYSDDASGSDYYIFVGGSNNIVRNCYSERAYPDSHGGHGIGIKTQGVREPRIHWATHNLFENNEVVGTLLGLELRHSKVQYNVIRNIRFTNGIINDVIDNYPDQFPEGYDRRPGGFVLRDDTKFNIIENCYLENVRVAVNFRDTSEDNGAQPSAQSNVLRNCIFNGGRKGIVASLGGSDARVIDNVFINNVWYDIDEMYSGGSELYAGNNRMINSIFMNTASRLAGTNNLYYDRSGFHETYCSYYGNGYASPTTTGTLDGDPLFTDANNGDFTLRAGSPAMNTGTVTNNNYGFEGNERALGSVDRGAHQN